MQDPFDYIYQMITNHPSNDWAKLKGYKPVYTASGQAKILIVGQAPGIRAQESGIPWNDVSGDKLRDWLGIDRDIFYDSGKIALVPMDFYYPGKGKHGDLPPRKDFAPMWHPQLLEHMPDIKLTLLVGKFAQDYYLGARKQRNLTETVKNYETYMPEFLPTVHPSPLTFRWQTQNPWFAEQVIPLLRTRVQEIL